MIGLPAAGVNPTSVLTQQGVESLNRTADEQRLEQSKELEERFRRLLRANIALNTVVESPSLNGNFSSDNFPDSVNIKLFYLDEIPHSSIFFYFFSQTQKVA